MTNERPISKEHAEQIWEAILAAAAQGYPDSAIAVSKLINARRQLDEQTTTPHQTETNLMSLIEQHRKPNTHSIPCITPL